MNYASTLEECRKAATASTYLALHCHIIFGTKGRVPLIDPDWKNHLYAYMAGILQEMEVVPESIGGTADHTHILAGFRATHAIADIVHELKRGSSAWVHTGLNHSKFAWQTGYAALTVSPSQTEAVKLYIESQEEHHRHRSFQEEYRELLEKVDLLHPFQVRRFRNKPRPVVRGKRAAIHRLISRTASRWAHT